MAHSKPTSTQQALYQFVVQNASIGPKARLVSHHLPNAVNHEHLVATAQLQGDAPAHFTMSLPQLSNKVFIGITDAHPEPLAKLIASFSADSETNDALAVGHAEEIQSPTLKQFGWNAILMTSPSKRLGGFPDTATVEGDDFDFILVTLITASEYEHWRREGYDSLMAQFSAQKRDWSSFYQNNKGSNPLAGPEGSPNTKTVQTVDRDIPRTTTTPSAEAPAANAPQVSTRSTAPNTRPQVQAQPTATVSQPIRSAILTPNRPIPSSANSTNSRTSSTAPSNRAPARPTPRNMPNSAGAARQPVPNKPSLNQSAPVQHRQTTEKASATLAGSPSTTTNPESVAQTRARPQQVKSMSTQRTETSVATAAKQRDNTATPVTPPRAEHRSTPYSEDPLLGGSLRINLGIEPSEAFITGNTETLTVGEIPDQSTRSKKAATAKVSAYRQQPVRDAVPADDDYDNDDADDMAYEDYPGVPVNPAKFEAKALKNPSPTRSGVVSKRMPPGSKPSAKAAKTKRAIQRNMRTNTTKRLRNQAANRLAKKHASRRHQQLSALDEAITDQWASSIVSINREKQSNRAKQSATQNTSVNFPEDYDDQASLQDLSKNLAHQPISQWQVLGETALGTLLLVGGLFTTLYFMDTDIPTASIFPGVFAVAGIVTLASAFKDALRLEYTDTDN